MRDPQIALQTHAREELGLDPDELGSPWGAAGSSFVTFAFGAFVPLVPFLVGSGTAAAVWSAFLGAITLFAVGALVSILTGKRFWEAGGRMVLVGAAAATITFLIGKLLDAGLGLS
jgi:VIT1/CCC1 family predicted Fe2+/Mn2+ transporter